MEYIGVTLEDTLHIETVYSVHYFEYMSNFSFGGESHDFWEFLFVDKGTVSITADTTVQTLKTGDIIFHEPNEFHDVNAISGVAPNLIVVSFSCSNSAIEFFRKKQFTINDLQKKLLGDILTEATDCFAIPLDNPYLKKVLLSENCTIGSQQILRMKIELFLLSLLRSYSIDNKNKPSLPSKRVIAHNNDINTFHEIITYFHENQYTTLTLPQICKVHMISQSKLQKLFYEFTNQGVMETFYQLKIKEAKNLIRTGNYNFTQIAEILGYSSVHYFSRQFKNITDMTPTEYATSVKILAELL